MSHNLVNWFEIPVKDMPRAKKFYEKVFAIELRSMDMDDRKMAMFPMNEKVFGASGSLVLEKSYVPSHAGTLIYFSVEDIDAMLKKVKENGGKILVPKQSIGEYGAVGYFEDTEGNRVAFHSMA